MVPAFRQEPDDVSTSQDRLRARMESRDHPHGLHTDFEAGDGSVGVMPSAEFDGDPASILHEFDAFER